MGDTAYCHDDCHIECPPDQEAYCSYTCDSEGRCTCTAWCCTTNPFDDFLTLESFSEILEKTLEQFINAPIDPIGPFRTTLPKMRLWQFARILKAMTNIEIFIPASRVMEEISFEDGIETTHSEMLERLGLIQQERDMATSRKPLEEMSDKERRVVEILNERKREILAGFREVLLNNDLDLHVVGYMLHEHAIEYDEEGPGCCCADPPPEYAYPCSACGWGGNVC